MFHPPSSLHNRLKISQSPHFSPNNSDNAGQNHSRNLKQVREEQKRFPRLLQLFKFFNYAAIIEKQE
jgi:hypothetical protein